MPRPEELQKQKQTYEFKPQDVQDVLDNQAYAHLRVGEEVRDYKQNEGYRGQEATKRDMALIDQALEGNLVALDQKSIEKLKVIQGRNKAHEMLNMGVKTFGDSDLMKEVKKTVKELEKLLNYKAKQITVDFLDEVEQAYADAIAACQNYSYHKDPGYEKGKERKRLVDETLNRILVEANEIAYAKKQLAKGKYSGQPEKGTTVTARDLLIEAQYDLACKRLQKNKEDGQEEEEQQAQADVQAENVEQEPIITERRQVQMRPLNMKKLHKNAQRFVRLMLGERHVANYKTNVKMKDEILKLQRVLRNFRPGEAGTQFVCVADTCFKITQSEAGLLKLRKGNEEMEIPYGAVAVARNLENELLQNKNAFTTRQLSSAANAMQQAEPGEKVTNRAEARAELQHLRNAYSEILEKAFPELLRKEDLINIPLKRLGEMTQMKTATEIVDALRFYDNRFDSFNQEILERRRYADEGAGAVEIKKGKNYEGESDAEQTKREQLNHVKKIFETVIFPASMDLLNFYQDKKTEMDEDAFEEPKTLSQQMYDLMMENASAFIFCIRDEKGLKGILDSFHFPEVKEGQKSIKEMYINLFSDLRAGIKSENTWSYAVKMLTDITAKGMLEETLSGPDSKVMQKFLEDSKEIFKQTELVNKQSAEVLGQFKQEENPNQEVWSEREVAVKNLIADLISSPEYWAGDEVKGVPKDPITRTKEVLLRNVDGLAYMMADEKLATRMLDKLPLPDTGDMKKKLLKALSGIPTGGLDFKAPHAVLYAAVKTKLDDPEMIETLMDIQTNISDTIDAASEQLQEQMTQAVNSVFKPVAKEENLPPLKDPNTPGLEEEEKKKIVEEGNRRLTHIMEECMKGDSGQGMFTKQVLTNYFSGVSAMDKRAMFSAAFRYAPAKGKYKGKTKEDREEYQNKQQAGLLGAILKGAGPLLQKMMQGLPEGSLPDELLGAVSDMKSKLAPIPDSFVKAELQSMIDNSNGQIEKIVVEKSLGAASVGQAFMCKLYRPGQAEPEDVVVKILRPDVRNHMARERELMLKCARDTDNYSKLQEWEKAKAEAEKKGEPIPPKPEQKEGEIGGMEATYLGALQRIEEELDLTAEAKNVEAGKVYDKELAKLSEEKKREKKEAKGEKVWHDIYERKHDRVKAMKVNNISKPTKSCLMLERAEGTTLDSYIKDTNEEIRQILQKYEDVKDGGLAQQEYFEKDRIRLMELMLSAQKKHARMLELSEKWVEEGVYGSGYYHGDLHSGNIMITDEKLTVIDFGNVTQLTKKQQTAVSNMVLAAMLKKTDLFFDSLKSILEGTNPETFEKKRPELEKILTEVLKLGDEGSTGLRIGAALMKTQQLGLEIPPAIYNFSQCQMRLQNSVADSKEVLENLTEAIVKLDKKHQGGMVLNSPLRDMVNSSETDIHKRTQQDYLANVKKAKRMYFLPTKEELVKQLRDTSDEALEDLEENHVVMEFIKSSQMADDFVKECEKYLEIPEEERTQDQQEALRKKYVKLHNTMSKEVSGDKDDQLDDMHMSVERFIDDADEGNLNDVKDNLKPVYEKKNLYEKYNNLRKLQKNKKSTEEQRQAAEDAFCEEYLKLHQELVLDQNANLRFIRAGFESAKDEMQKDMGHAFVDEEYGKRLKELYEEAKSISSSYNQTLDKIARLEGEIKTCRSNIDRRQTLKDQADALEKNRKLVTGELDEKLSPLITEIKKKYETLIDPKEDLKKKRQLLFDLNGESKRILDGVMTQEQKHLLLSQFAQKQTEAEENFRQKQLEEKAHQKAIEDFYKANGGILDFQKEVELKNTGLQAKKEKAIQEGKNFDNEATLWKNVSAYLNDKDVIGDMREQQEELVNTDYEKQIEEKTLELQPLKQSAAITKAKIDTWADEFEDKYLKVLSKNFDRIIANAEAKKEATSNSQCGREADNFLDVMGVIGERHKLESLKRLGWRQSRQIMKAM